MLIVRSEVAMLDDSAGEHARIGETRPDQPKLEFPHVFRTVDDSELLTVFHRQSFGIHKDHGVLHDELMGYDQRVDAPSSTAPTFNGDVG